MTRTLRSLRLAAILLPAIWANSGTAGDAPELALYEASYEVAYKGRRIGESDFSMTYDETTGTYVFESRTRARGLAKLLRPNAAIERSRFSLHDGLIRPLAFHFEDGSRKGEDNVDIAFDWDARQAAVQSDSGTASFPLAQGVLDRAALQAALMHDLSRGLAPGPYTLVDDDALKTYHYSIGERRTVETEAGRFDAIAVTQEREGSSRTTLMWVAPDLGHLPVLIEQYRDGEAYMSMTLQDYSPPGA